MKSNILKCIGLLAVLTLTACSDDDTDPVTIDEHITTPNSGGKSPVKSIERSGSFKDAYDWTFKYTEKGKMFAADGVRENAPDGNDASYSYEIVYGTDKVVVSNTAGDVLEFTVNNTNYMIATAKSKDREYRYTYADGRLAGWDLLTYDTGFNTTSRLDSKAEMVWDNGNLKKVIYTPFTVNESETVTYELEYTTLLNENGILPEVNSEALGCKGFEFVYYAGMFGKATKNLVNKITVTDVKEPSNNATYLFADYTFNNNDGSNNLKHFNYRLESEPTKIAIVSFGY